MHIFAVSKTTGMAVLVEKSISGGVVDVDRSSRRIVMNWNATGEIDHDGDLITPDAFNKTISERGPGGADLIYWLSDHWATLDNVVGKVDSLSVVGNHLQAVGIASNTTKGNDVLQLYLDGIIKQHSVGFVPIRTENAKDHRVIKEVMLFEGSSVLWGANSNTGTVSVAKSLTAEECADELDKLLKAFKNGTYTDETFGLLELRIKQIQKNYAQLLAAPPNGTQPPAPSDDDTQRKQEEAEKIKSLTELKHLLSWN